MRDGSPQASIRVGNDRMASTAWLAMGLSDASQPTGETHFYTEGSALEAERLRMMAEIADNVSIDVISLLRGRLGRDDQPIVVADIGAGDSTTLGDRLTAMGNSYIPIDMRQEAVHEHQTAGFDAVQSIATQLALESGSVDIAHARFTWGWLSDVERLQSLAEMLRIGHDDMAVAILDYDWSQVSGPDIFVKMVDQVKAIMHTTGFDSEYGARVANDLPEKLARLVEGQPKLMMMRMATYEGPIGGGLQIIAQTARAIAEQLSKMGMSSRAEALLKDLETLQQYASSHPHEQISLPSIVAVGATVYGAHSKFTPTMRTYLDASEAHDIVRHEQPSLIEGVDFYRALPDVPSLAHVAIATSDRMVLEARRIQTTAYYKDDIIGFDAVDSDGVLVGGSDPIELVRRSTYFVPLGTSMPQMRGVVRTIAPDLSIGLPSLPTIQRLYQHSPLTAAKLAQYPWESQPHNVIEVSGLAKNMLGGSLEDVMLAMLVLAETTVRSGRRYGVMGLQESKVGLIEHLFGTSAVRRIEGEDAVHPIQLPGVREGSRFVPLYVDGGTFVEDVYAHASRRSSPLFARLAQASREILDARPSSDL